MIIKYVIMSMDDNPLYQKFWDINKDLWYNNIGITPILVHVTDDLNSNYSINYYDKYIIFKIKKILNINSGFQAQISRLFITQFFLNDVLLTSDIDMFPLSKNYFNSINDIDENKMVIFSSDAYNNEVRYPMCYNAAKGKIFSSILNLNNSFKEFCEKLLTYNWGWDTDEKFFSSKIVLRKDDCVFLKRGWINGVAKNRIDRVNWNYDVSKLKEGGYIDSHSLRPFELYSNEINKLINHVKFN